MTSATSRASGQSFHLLRTHQKHPPAARPGWTGTTLVLIDEPGAGTDPAEGAPLARAILETLLESGALVLDSTHYHELKFFAFRDPRILSASVALDPQTNVPLFTLKTGEPGASRALDTARRLGLPERVLARAEALIPAETRTLKKPSLPCRNAQPGPPRWSKRPRRPAGSRSRSPGAIAKNWIAWPQPGPKSWQQPGRRPSRRSAAFPVREKNSSAS